MNVKTHQQEIVTFLNKLMQENTIAAADMSPCGTLNGLTPKSESCNKCRLHFFSQPVNIFLLPGLIITKLIILSRLFQHGIKTNKLLR